MARGNNHFVNSAAERRPNGRSRSWSLQLSGMGLAVPFSSEIFVDQFRENPDLFGNECEERFWRSFAGTERAAGITQIAKHERTAEAVVIATAATDHREVSVGQCVMADQLTLISPADRITLRSGLRLIVVLVSPMPPRPWRPGDQPIRARESIRLMPNVRQTAASLAPRRAQR